MPSTELRSEVEVDAPVERVFQVLTELERYPEWNPFLTSGSGSLVVGQRLTLDLSLPEGDSYVLRPTITHLTENAELRWSGHFLLPALLRLEQLFLVSPARTGTGGRTRLVQGLNFSGLLLRYSGKALTQAARGAVYMNQALKKRAENRE
jgi:hypothetical protein